MIAAVGGRVREAPAARVPARSWTDRGLTLQTPAPPRRGPRRPAKRGGTARRPTATERGAELASRASRLVERQAGLPRARRGGRRASSPAGRPPAPRRSRARGRGARPPATTSVTSPQPSASAASTTRPVRIISSARPMPTIRGSRCVPPSISGTPKRRSVNPSFAVSVATRRSHHSASSRPPARHQPEIAAIVGFDARQPREAQRTVGRALEPPSHRRRRSLSTPGLGDGLQVGAGAERLVVPSPARISTRASSSASKRWKPSAAPPRSRRRRRCAARGG